MPHFNPLVAEQAPPPIAAVHAWARAYSGAKGPVIDLSQAAPGYPPHPLVLELLGRAARDARDGEVRPYRGRRRVALGFGPP